jgi:hypothetical protein
MSGFGGDTLKGVVNCPNGCQRCPNVPDYLIQRTGFHLRHSKHFCPDIDSLSVSMGQTHQNPQFSNDYQTVSKFPHSVKM